MTLVSGADVDAQKYLVYLALRANEKPGLLEPWSIFPILAITMIIVAMKHQP